VRVAILHHWFISRSGGERVAELFSEMFPDADIYTLVGDEKVFDSILKDRRVYTSFLQRLPGAHKYHRHLLALYPLAVEQLDLTGYDLILSSDSGPIKGVITRPGAVHICYCHSPMRYLWDQYAFYRKSLPWVARWPFTLAAHYVRMWDYCGAQRVTQFVANSNYVASRITSFYRRDSIVVYPPVDTTRGFISNAPKEYYLSVGRMVPYKRTEILIEACNRLGVPLRVIGIGPEMRRLRSMAGPTITFLGEVSTEELWKNYADAKALLFAAQEDFGIVPLEAQACGRPVIAYGQGGSLETIRPLHPADGDPSLPPTGAFFLEQTPEAVMEAIRDFESNEALYSPESIQQHARAFDTSVFLERMREVLKRWLG